MYYMFMYELKTYKYEEWKIKKNHIKQDLEIQNGMSY